MQAPFDDPEAVDGIFGWEEDNLIASIDDLLEERMQESITLSGDCWRTQVENEDQKRETLLPRIEYLYPLG